jgi:hypothetical protein
MTKTKPKPAKGKISLAITALALLAIVSTNTEKILDHAKSIVSIFWSSGNPDKQTPPADPTQSIITIDKSNNQLSPIIQGEKNEVQINSSSSSSSNGIPKP